MNCVGYFSCSESSCSNLDDADNANEEAACIEALGQLDDTAGYICGMACSDGTTCVGFADLSVILIGPVDEQTVLGSLTSFVFNLPTGIGSGGVCSDEPTTIDVQFGTADNGATVSPDDVNDVFEGKPAAWGIDECICRPARGQRRGQRRGFP